MQKFLTIPVLKTTKTTGTSAGSGAAGKLTSASDDFVADGVAAGDVVLDSGSAAYVVASVESPTVLVLVSGTFPNSTAYSVLKAGETRDVIVAANGISGIDGTPTTQSVSMHVDTCNTDMKRLNLIHTPATTIWKVGDEIMENVVELASRKWTVPSKDLVISVTVAEVELT